MTALNLMFFSISWVLQWHPQFPFPKGEAFSFLDLLLRRQDAWLPDYEYLPWGETIQADSATAEDFVRVDAICLPWS